MRFAAGPSEPIVVASLMQVSLHLAALEVLLVPQAAFHPDLFLPLSRLRHGDVVTSVLQPNFRDCHHQAWQLVRHHYSKVLAESPFFAV
jgi:hypothetical protein